MNCVVKMTFTDVGNFFQGSIGFIDHDDIGQFCDTTLDTLELIPASGLNHENKSISQLPGDMLRLANSNCFKKNDVVSGCCQKCHQFHTPSSNPSQKAAGRT